MAIQGLRSTFDYVPFQRPLNWREGYLYLEPNGMASLVALTSLMKSRAVDDPMYNWWEKPRNQRRFQLGADLTNSNTVITIAADSSGAIENSTTTTPLATELKDGDLLRVENTDEIIQVSGDPTSDTTITVIRGIAGTTKTAVDYDGSGVNPYLSLIGSAYEEGSLAPTSVRYDPRRVFNFTQIFRDTLAHTRTAMKTNLRTPDDVKEAKKDCFDYHVQAIERAFWFGKKSEFIRNGEPARTTDGVLQRIHADNVHDVNSEFSGGLDMEGLEEYLRQMFTFGSSQKMAFCGNAALLVLNQIVRKNSTMFIEPGIKEYGMDVTKLTCPFGELTIKTHKMFNQLPGGTNGGGAYYGMSNNLVVLDMDNIQYVYLDGSDTQYEPDLTPVGMDGKKSGYLSECSIAVALPETHFWLKNLNKAAIDS